MKYTAKLVNDVLKSIQNHPLHTFWKCYIDLQLDEFQLANIHFNDIDDNTMIISISSNHAECYVETANGIHKWFASCNLSAVNRDTFFMWLGITVEKMYHFCAFEIEEG